MKNLLIIAVLSFFTALPAFASSYTEYDSIDVYEGPIEVVYSVNHKGVRDCKKDVLMGKARGLALETAKESNGRLTYLSCKEVPGTYQHKHDCDSTGKCECYSSMDASCTFLENGE